MQPYFVYILLHDQSDIFFGGGRMRAREGYDPEIWNRPRFLYNAATHQVSLSYV